MKKILGLMTAMALLVPVGIVAAGPGGAAAAGTTCKGASGKITLKPGLTAKAAVQTISINLPITGCTGGGVKSASFKGSLVTKAISTTSILKSAAPLKLTSVITWDTKTTSNLVANSSTKIVGKIINSTVTGKISKGTFAGLTFTSKQTVTLGPLTGGKITSLNVKASSPVTIK